MGQPIDGRFGTGRYPVRSRASQAKVELVRKDQSNRKLFGLPDRCLQYCEKSMQTATPKLNDRLIDIVKQTVVDALETSDVEHHKNFIKAALRSALNRLLVSTLDDSSCIKESFEDAIIQGATAPNLSAVIASVVTKDSAAMTPIARYATRIVKQKLEKSAKD